MENKKWLVKPNLCWARPWFDFDLTERYVALIFVPPSTSSSWYGIGAETKVLN